MQLIRYIPNRFKSAIRDKAIKRAETRIILAGRQPQDFEHQDLEIIVQEEEEKLKSEIRDKGLFAVLAMLGLSWF